MARTKIQEILYHHSLSYEMPKIILNKVYDSNFKYGDRFSVFDIYENFQMICTYEVCIGFKLLQIIYIDEKTQKIQVCCSFAKIWNNVLDTSSNVSLNFKWHVRNRRIAFLREKQIYFYKTFKKYEPFKKVAKYAIKHNNCDKHQNGFFETMVSFTSIILNYDHVPNKETLLKINPELYFNLYINRLVRFHPTFEMCLDKFGRQFQLITKYKYKIKKENIGDYIDYLMDLKELGKDIHNKKFLCATKKDILNTHRAYRKKLEKERTIAERIRKEKEILKREKENNEYITKMSAFELFECSIDNLIIKPLLTPDDVIKEGNDQNHCVAGYIGNKNSLLFTSFFNNKKAETIEYSIVKKEVVQARKKNNGNHKLHDKIVGLANTYINKYIKESGVEFAS